MAQCSILYNFIITVDINTHPNASANSSSINRCKEWKRKVLPNVEIFQHNWTFSNFFIQTEIFFCELQLVHSCGETQILENIFFWILNFSIEEKSRLNLTLKRSIIHARVPMTDCNNLKNNFGTNNLNVMLFFIWNKIQSIKATFI